MEFKDRVRELRLAYNLLQKDLGEKIGVKRQSVSGWENGTREPNISVLIKLSEFFECSIDYLLGRTDNKKSVDYSVATTDLENTLKMSVGEYLKLLEFAKDASKDAIKKKK